MSSNNLGTYDALQLENGFFSETSKTRNSLFNTHVNSQMSKIGEDYKENYKESVQGFFDKSKSNEEMGAEISEFIKDATKNGISNSTAQKYLLESLKEYAETTGDLDFAQRLLRELPNNIKLGTGALIKGSSSGSVGSIYSSNSGNSGKGEDGGNCGNGCSLYSSNSGISESVSELYSGSLFTNGHKFVPAPL